MKALYISANNKDDSGNYAAYEEPELLELFEIISTTKTCHCEVLRLFSVTES